jgi:hypothetical protein
MRGTAFILMSLLLASCGEVVGASPRPGAQMQDQPVPVATPAQKNASLTLACASTVDASVLADPERLKLLRSNCLEELNSSTEGLALSEAGRDAVLATMLAYRFAPYGASRATSLEALLKEKQLDCDNYILLAGYILEKLRPGVSLVYVGFDGGAVGNHAEAFFEDEGGAVFLDPTVGIAATVGFDDLVSGKMEGVRLIVDSRTPEPAVAPLHARVEKAVVQGGYRPSDLLYYFTSREDLIRFGEHTGPLWDGDRSLLVLHYPTPGSKGLKKNLGLK